MQPLTLQVKGLRLAAQAAGDPDGPRVIALHGWLDNSESFAQLASELDGCHFVALDFPGHGLSEHRPEGALYHMSDYVSDVAGAIAALGWDRATLVGHSMGAGVACLLAAALPERVERLILIEGLGPMSADAAKAAQSLRTATRGLLTPRADRGRRFDDVAQAVAARQLATPEVAPLALEAIVRRNLRRADDGFRWRTDARLRLPSPQPYMEESVMTLLSEIHAPALVIEAAEGYLRGKSWFERRCAALKRVDRLVVCGDHHLHTGAAAAQIAVAIRRFLTDPPAGEPDA